MSYRQPSRRRETSGSRSTRPVGECFLSGAFYPSIEKQPGPTRRLPSDMQGSEVNVETGHSGSIQDTN